MNKNYTLGIIGYGNMAKAILKGLTAAESAPKIIVSDIDSALFPKSDGKIKFTTDNAALAREADIILFAVKPNCAEDAARLIGDAVSCKTVVSIMAGISIKTLGGFMPSAKYIIRVMPNLCATALM
ncbi:MAG: NAD(P)-binding domain-containing protein, partial [Clostridiales bacterium]|nr:NAD(P)-binding domain-containing protein [Clostridiales bacterium]